MPDINTQRAQFLADNPEVGVLLNQPGWRKLRVWLSETGPHEKLADVPPEEMVTKGVIYAAQIQGRIDCLRDIDSLANVEAPYREPEATYANDDFLDVPEAAPISPTRRSRKK